MEGEMVRVTLPIKHSLSVRCLDTNVVVNGAQRHEVASVPASPPLVFLAALSVAMRRSGLSWQNEGTW